MLFKHPRGVPLVLANVMTGCNPWGIRDAYPSTRALPLSARLTARGTLALNAERARENSAHDFRPHPEAQGLSVRGAGVPFACLLPHLLLRRDHVDQAVVVQRPG
jgi:hypothetical protein